MHREGDRPNIADVRDFAVLICRSKFPARAWISIGIDLQWKLR